MYRKNRPKKNLSNADRLQYLKSKLERLQEEHERRLVEKGHETFDGAEEMERRRSRIEAVQQEIRELEGDENN